MMMMRMMMSHICLFKESLSQVDGGVRRQGASLRQCVVGSVGGCQGPETMCSGRLSGALGVQEVRDTTASLQGLAGTHRSVWRILLDKLN